MMLKQKMTHEKHENSNIYQWFNDGIGAKILIEEINIVTNLIENANTNRIMQLGGIPLVKPNMSANFIHYDENNNFPSLGYNIYGEFNNISIGSSCIDLIVIPHIHEHKKNHEEIFVECSRILKDEGLILIIGFNPVSLWGIQKILKISNVVPWCNRFYNANYICKKMQEHDFNLIEKTNAYYGFYSNRKIIYDKIILNRNAGRHNFGAIYALLVKKTSMPGSVIRE